MKKTVHFLLALALALTSLGGFASCGENEILYLNVYNAEEYISEYDEEWETVDVIGLFEEWASEKYGKKAAR